MSNRPWMPLYIADYLSDTRHLTTIQHGAYLLLIMHYWRTGGLPNDDAQLARIVQMAPHTWARWMKPKLAPLFVIAPDRWHHKRIDQELAKREELSMKRAVFGSRGGMASNTFRSFSKMRTPFSSGWQNNGFDTNPLKSNGAHQAMASPQLSNCSHSHIRKKEATEEERSVDNGDNSEFNPDIDEPNQGDK